MARTTVFERSGAARIMRVASHARSSVGAAARDGAVERSRVWGRVAKFLSVVTAPLLLAGCFLTPGAFDSSLDLRRNGDFTFTYKGEIVFAIPDDMAGGKPGTWSDVQAKCFDGW